MRLSWKLAGVSLLAVTVVMVVERSFHSLLASLAAAAACTALALVAGRAMSERLADATARLEAEKRISAVEALRHADRLMTVGQLAAGLAHEIGTRSTWWPGVPR